MNSNNIEDLYKLVVHAQLWIFIKSVEVCIQKNIYN